MNRPRAEFLSRAGTLAFRVNGRKLRVASPRVARLADVLREVPVLPHRLRAALKEKGVP